MNEEKILQGLVSKSRGDNPPLIDVTQRVLAQIQIAPPRRNLLLWAYAAVSSVAAVFVVALAIWTLMGQDEITLELMPSMMAGLL